jgi:ribonuclease P protein component
VAVHLVTANVDKATNGLVATDPCRVGFVVSRAVGPAVTRNRVKRRLRHLVRARVDRLQDGSLLVVRALPASAGATFSDLGAELDRCLARVGVS